MSQVILLSLNWRHADEIGAMTKSAIALPLEYVYISSGLKVRNIVHRHIDTWLDDKTIADIAADIRRASVVVVDSCPSYVFWRDGIINIGVVSKAVADIRSIHPEAKIVLIGPHASVLPESFDGVDLDFIVRGEPDIAVPELVHRLLSGGGADGMSGILDVKNAREPSTVGSVQVNDLADLPSLDFSHFRIADYVHPTPHGPQSLIGGRLSTMYETSRGCPYRCIYCFKVGFRDIFRMKPLAVIDRDLQVLAEAGVGYVYLIDEIFFLDADWSLSVIELLGKHGLAWGCQTRPSALSDTVVEGIVRAGNCGLIQIGLEHTNPGILKSIGKADVKVDFLREAVEKLVGANVKIQLFLVTGLPGESVQTIRDMGEALRAFPTDVVDAIVHDAMPFPGTALWSLGQRQGLPLQGWEDVRRYAGIIGNEFTTRKELKKETFRLVGRISRMADERRIRERRETGRGLPLKDYLRYAKHTADMLCPTFMAKITDAYISARERR